MTRAPGPQLATEQISVERGTWQVNPDGTMDTTWRIRSGVKWHDGTPLTSADFLFAFNAFEDPAIATGFGQVLRLMASASAPDALTFVVHWRGPYVDADQALALIALPRHLMEDLFQSDRANFTNSPRLSTEFIGVGPYKLVRWEPGSHIEFVRFDDYFQGRPPLDRVVLRFIGDPNTMVATILAGAVDVVLVGPTIESATEIRSRWEGTGNQVLFSVADKFAALWPQQREEVARPRNGLRQTMVRQAFYQAIDRQTLAGVLATPVADSWFAPNHELRPRLESAIPQFSYDPGQAQRLLAQAGWIRGPDGILIQPATGDRFETQLSASVGRESEKALNIIAGDWRAIGAQVDIYLEPPEQNDKEVQLKFPGAKYGIRSADAPYKDALASKQVAGPDNRWGGSNQHGYSNSKLDTLLDRLAVTFGPTERLAIHRELLQEGLGDVATMPLHWRVDPILILKSVKGLAPQPRGEHTWNMFQLDKEPYES